MDLVTLADIETAARTIAGIAIRTPLLPAAWAGDLWLKPENLQPIGAFKIRGAANAVAALDDASAGVITHSSGNHGRALGYVARERGIPCVIVVPDAAPRVKVEAMRATGAQLHLVPGDERESTALSLAREHGLTLIPPYDHPAVIAGQGTIGLEVLSDLPGIETIVVPIGGGGLASGVGVAVKALSPNVRVIGVEPELAADAADSLRRGVLTPWPAEQTYRTIADGARTALAERTFAHIRQTVDEIVTITDAQIQDAVGTLARNAKLIAEPTGALATAAYLRHGKDWGRTAAVISGGNIEPGLLARLVTRGAE